MFIDRPRHSLDVAEFYISRIIRYKTINKNKKLEYFYRIKGMELTLFKFLYIEIYLFILLIFFFIKLN